MATWRYALQNPDGTLISPLPQASGRRISVRRNEFPEASFTLGLDDADSGSVVNALHNGIPILRVWRDELQPDSSITPVIRFSGFISPESVTESVDEEKTMSVTATPVGKLEKRYTPELRGFSGPTDAGQVAWELIEDANDGFPAFDEPGSDTGIQLGSIQPSHDVDPVYERAHIPPAIQDLAEGEPGFDFELAPVEEGSKVATFNVFTNQGTGRDITFAHGEGTLDNVQSVSRTRQPLRNRVLVFGDSGVVWTKLNQDSIDRYGLHDHHESMPEIIDAPILQARAQELLTPFPKEEITFTPEPEKAYTPFVDFDIGDTVAAYVRLDHYAMEGLARVEEIVIDIDDDDNETHTVSVVPT